MRPKKKIMLCGEDEKSLSVLRYLLLTNGFNVTASPNAREALELLRQGGQWDLLLLELPLAGIDELLLASRALAYSLSSIVVPGGLGKVPDEYNADLVFCVTPSSAELMERVKTALARKRGPKPARKVDSALVKPEYVRILEPGNELPPHRVEPVKRLKIPWDVSRAVELSRRVG